MELKITPQQKTGLFVLIALFLLGYATLRISKSSLIPGSTYNVYVTVDSASGITDKTPVEIAGIRVGYVSEVNLIENNRAKLTLAINRGVKISSQVQARFKTVGFLGDLYIELYQPGPMMESLKSGGTITSSANYGDFSSLTGQLNDIATDVKAITSTMKNLMAGDDSSFAHSLHNIERITDSLANVSTQNEGNLNAIIANLKDLSVNLNQIVQQHGAQVGVTLDNVAEITNKVKNGEGTLGRLVNDDETVDKINDTIDNVNGLLGGINKLQVDVGYHTEYLGTSKNFKQYVALNLKPTPDKYFMFEFVNDPEPDPTFSSKTTTITSGGTTSTIQEDVENIPSDKFRFSAEFAKKYYDFTFRGGLIESSGGVGVDYGRGPYSLKFSAFDLRTNHDRRPHLKAMGTLNVSHAFYLLGGVDDFISKQQDPDWLVGAGLQITDDDIRSIIGLAGSGIKP